MQPKTSTKIPLCPVAITLQLINNCWKILIIQQLLSGSKRFSQLQKLLGTVTQKVLTTNLRDLEKNALITRTVYPEVPPRVEYALTDTGLSLKPILDTMVACGENYQKSHKELTK